MQQLDYFTCSAVRARRWVKPVLLVVIVCCLSDILVFEARSQMRVAAVATRAAAPSLGPVPGLPNFSLAGPTFAPNGELVAGTFLIVKEQCQGPQPTFICPSSQAVPTDREVAAAMFLALATQDLTPQVFCAPTTQPSGR